MQARDAVVTRVFLVERLWRLCWSEGSSRRLRHRLVPLIAVGGVEGLIGLGRRDEAVFVDLIIVRDSANHRDVESSNTTMRNHYG